LQGIATGVYTLDILVQRGNTVGVYETILVGSVLIDPGSEPGSEPVDDPCNYYGLNICDENGDCDSERFDCWSDCRDGSTAVTGQCPETMMKYAGKMVSILTSAGLLQPTTKGNKKMIQVTATVTNPLIASQIS
jgi:hypothetical protein